MITTQLKLHEIWNNNLPSSSSSLTPSSSSIIILSPSVVVSKDLDCEIEILSKDNIVQQITTATDVNHRTQYLFL
ncbi:unnamed protein product [Rotaria magnacalcarata]|uniref:Uncharacterized protein n=3 Tax=Rotaria magnacalcarata TaxID=392030 RepID=A0A816XZX3_9BILA|nr:unnamed protein product [Rotaria magnacalcarata]CAF1287614.1 unnamed protein product [Rotaria magnacalcarata]CAF2151056.1 unnamed protein product [Rotaria magnacalcarata]CAF2156175.1 unnamed protein product [Rotaria magnacalcarata]CAF3729634.1 unnamed protein product [Rotaria magnacalcarata]